MITVRSTRDFHSKLDAVCSSIEALFNLAADDDLVTAAQPALVRFRELLDAADSICAGPETGEEGTNEAGL